MIEVKEDEVIRLFSHNKISNLLCEYRARKAMLQQTSRAISHEEFLYFLRSKGITQPIPVKRQTQALSVFARTTALVLPTMFVITGIYALWTNSTSKTVNLAQLTSPQNNPLFFLLPTHSNVQSVSFANSSTSVAQVLLPTPQAQTDLQSTLAQDLQNLINQWATSTHSRNSIEIYDLDNDTILATYNEGTSLNVASLYKLFYAYDGYTQIDLGMMYYDQPYLSQYTYGNCLNLIISASDNQCAEQIMSHQNNINRVLELNKKLQLTHTTDAVLTSSASDITKLLKYIYQHPDLSQDSWNKLADSMLNQKRSDLRQGLPNGFTTAQVYAKAGFDNTSYNEAAIIEFPSQNRHFSIAILTQNLPSYTYLTQLGTNIESIILKHIQ